MDTSRQGIPRFSTVAQPTDYRLHLLGMGNLGCLRVTVPTGKISMGRPRQLLGVDRRQAPLSWVNHPGDFRTVTSQAFFGGLAKRDKGERQQECGEGDEKDPSSHFISNPGLGAPLRGRIHISLGGL